VKVWSIGVQERRPGDAWWWRSAIKPIWRKLDRLQGNHGAGWPTRAGLDEGDAQKLINEGKPIYWADAHTLARKPARRRC